MAIQNQRSTKRLRRQGNPNGILDPLVIALAEQLDSCVDELSTKLGVEVGCSQCPVKIKCRARWRKEVVDRINRNLDLHAFRKISDQLHKLKLERDAILETRRPYHRPMNLVKMPCPKPINDIVTPHTTPKLRVPI